jgi:hypothetical protein
MLFNFVAWLRRQRSGPRSRPERGRRRLLQFETLEERTLLSTSIPLNPLSWTNIGPNTIASSNGFGNLAGEITAVVPDPSDQNHIFIGTGGGGVFSIEFNPADPTFQNYTATPLTNNIKDLATGSSDPGTGYIGALTLDPDNPKIIYAGTGEANYMPDSYAGKGILKSTDGGQSWTLLGSSDFTGYSIARVFVDWGNSNILFAAVTRGALGAASAPSGNDGIWRSTDGGTTWTDLTNVAGSPLAAAGNLAFTDVIVDPQNERLFFAVGEPAGNALNGIYFSDDALNPAVATPTFNQVALTLAGGAAPLTGTQIGRISLQSSWRGFYDHDWASITDPTGAQLMLGENTNGAAFWQDATPALQDMGASKNDPDLDLSNYLNNQYVANQTIFTDSVGNYTSPLAVDPFNSNQVALGGGVNFNEPPNALTIGGKQFSFRTDVLENYYNKVFTIADMGWGAIAQMPLPFGQQNPAPPFSTTGVFSHALAFSQFIDPASGFTGTDLWDATDTGLWVFQGSAASLDKNGNPQTFGEWFNLNLKLPTVQLNNVSLSPATADTLMAGERGVGAIQFQNSTSWTQTTATFFNAFEGTARTIIDPTDPTGKTVYEVASSSLESTSRLNFARSTDGGLTFTEQDQGLGTGDSRDPSLPLVLDVPSVPGSRPNRLLLGTDRLYVNYSPAATNVSWTLLNDSIFPGETITSIGAAATDVNTIYLGVGNTILKTTDNGVTWNDITPPGISAGAIFTNITVDPTNANIAYFVSPNSSLDGKAGRVWERNGTTWTDIGATLPVGLDPWSINMIPAATGIPNGVLLVGTDAGLYISKDLGATWALLGTGLPNVQIRDIEYNQALNTLAVATYGSGAWEIELQGSTTPPTISAPAALTANEDTPLPLTPPNAISVADAAVGGNTIQMSLAVTNGTLSLASTAGLTFTAGTGKNDLAESFTGTIAAIDTALAGLTYTPNTAYVGADTLTINANDLGHTGGILSIPQSSPTLNVPITVNMIQLSFEADPAPTTAGTALGSLAVDVQDLLGNLVPGAVVPVTIAVASGPGGFNVGATTLVAAVNGTATFAGLTLDTAGPYTLTASAPNVTPATTGLFAVTAGTATTLAFAGLPATATAGTPLPDLQVKIVDAFGNIDAGSGATVTLTVAGPGTVTGNFPPFPTAINGVATFKNLLLKTAGSYTFTAASTGLASATSAPLTVSPAAAAHLLFTSSPGTPTAGVALPDIQVSVIDVFGNLVSVTTSIMIAATGPGPLLAPNNVTTVAAVNGVATFKGFVLNTAGSYTLSASAAGLPTASSASFVVSPAAGVALAFPANPGNAIAGTLPALTVNVVDSFGNIATSTNTPIALSATPAGQLGGTITVTPVGGTATFSALTIDTVGTYTLTASAANLTSATSSSFTVSAAAASKLAFLNSPVNASTTQPLAKFQVALFDSFGNPVTTGGTPVTITANGPGGFAAGGTTTVSTVNGVATFTGLILPTAGSYTLTATAGALTGSSGSFTITQFQATALTFAGTVANVSAGAPLPSVQVNVLDQFGNLFINQNVQVTLAATGPGALGGTLSATSANGVATFTGLTLTAAGSYTLTASATGVTSATSNSFAVSAAADNQLTFALAPTSAGAGLLPKIQVAVFDAFGNPALASTAQITATATGPGAPSGATAVAALNGVATFSALTLQKAGSYTLTFTEGALTPLTSGAITISPGAASQLAFAPISPTTVTAGQALPLLKVNVVDAFGNLVPSSNAQVTIASGVAGGLKGTTSAPAVSGVASFSGLSPLTAGTYPLLATATGLALATSASLTVTPAAATQLVFEPFTTTIAAGQALQGLKVDLLDPFGNLATGSSTQVTLAANGPGAFSASSLRQPALNGVATFFSVSFTTPGSYTFTASAASITPALSVPLTVINGSPSKLVWLTTPSGGTANQTLPILEVEVLDAFGNLVTISGAQVMLAPSSPGTLSGTTSAPIVNGFATFPGLSFTKGGSFALTASLAGQDAVTTAPFTIGAAATSGSGSLDTGKSASHVVVAGVRFLSVPSRGTAGKTLSTIRVELIDRAGRVVKERVTITLTLHHGHLKGKISVTTNASGVATFTGLSVSAAGKYTLSAAAKGVKATASHTLTIAAPARVGRFR